MPPLKVDANEFPSYSIEKIKLFEHKLHRIAVSYDKYDISYSTNLEEEQFYELIEVIKEFSFQEFDKLDYFEKKEIFEQSKKILINFIYDSDNLIQKCAKLIKKCFKE